MGCKPTKDGEGTRSNDPQQQPLQQPPNPDLPPVPKDSWYDQPFSEQTPMPPSRVLDDARGMVLMGTVTIPTSDGDIATYLDQTSGHAMSKESFVLGQDHIFAMAVPFATPLNIEHAWRLRVKHFAASNDARKFDRPFYDTVVAVRVVINGQLVSDIHPGRLSLPNSTTTYPTHESVSVWLYTPIVLCPPPDHFTILMSSLYWDLVTSFVNAVCCLDDGDHAVRVEAVYGCKPEDNFATDFIAEGTFSLRVTRDGIHKVLPLVEQIERHRTRHASAGASEHLIVLPRDVAAGLGSCQHCKHPLKYSCAVCCAAVCGRPSCVRSLPRGGYPIACRTHRPAKELTQK